MTAPVRIHPVEPRLRAHYREHPEDLPLWINWFANPTAIAHAFGLNVDLPDLDDEDIDWSIFDHDGWRRALDGKVAGDVTYGDPDWVLLDRRPWGDLWYDLKEGVKIRSTVGQVRDALAAIRNAASTHGVPLQSDDCVGIGGELVCVHLVVLVVREDEATLLDNTALVKRGNLWVLPEDSGDHPEGWG